MLREVLASGTATNGRNERTPCGLALTFPHSELVLFAETLRVMPGNRQCGPLRTSLSALSQHGPDMF